MNAGQVPTWMTQVRTVRIMNDKSKGTVVRIYRPIACLPLMWKLLTGIFSESMYGHLRCQELFSNEQKGCRKNSRGTKDQLPIDKTRRLTNLSLAWIDYRNAFDMVHDMDFGMCKNGWSGPEYNHLDREQHGKFEDSVEVKPGCTWDSRLLWDTRTGYQLKKEGCKVNHLLFMDDLKLL